MAINYLSYSASQLALDESFQHWVLHPGSKHVFWENWALNYPEKTAVIEQARQLVLGIRFKKYEISEETKDQLLEAIWNGIEEEKTSQAPAIRPFRKWKQLTGYAAAIVAGVLIMAAWQYYNSYKRRPVLVSAHTSLGETKQLLLPDSSIVTLNANSKLLFSENANMQREVWLDGEAFFNVKHTVSSQPFIVHTYDNLDVKVLGTQFNVNSIGNEIVVVLETGSILLNINELRNSKATSLYLKPGEMIRYSKQDGSYSKRKVAVDQYTAWKSGKLVMDDFSLADVAVFMRQVFGKTLIVRDSQLLNYKVSGSMPIIYDPDTMMIQLSKVFRTRFNQRGDEIWIHK
ncbi:DUF4974 domain-containing protein [Chitinophaga silvatica]|uniref:DUF4974 domain-containing protein n=1 Tax=Chitinophaga silvatica TaxID=2282649 RepID=A0A3E1YHI8_9BACT|nr:FecR domain-containing protein [Chitinophaga silvatica]RFS26817.1 DUF4974 domain-containing protein [Chitinophaga silvatica]